VLSRLGVSFTLAFGGDPFDFADSSYIVIPGVLVSTTLMVVVSLLTKPSPPEKWAPFFRADVRRADVRRADVRRATCDVPVRWPVPPERPVGAKAGVNSGGAPCNAGCRLSCDCPGSPGVWPDEVFGS
jgi:hypothetical protein